jgi:hypothetical protein
LDPAYYFLSKSKTSPISLSFSPGFDVAISNVSVVKVPGVILSLKSKFALFKNQIKLKAPLRLLPSLNG